MHVSYKNRRGLNRPILRPLWLMTSAAADVPSVLSVGVVQAASSPILLFPDVRQLFRNISDELRFVLALWHININFHIIPCNVTRAVRWENNHWLKRLCHESWNITQTLTEGLSSNRRWLAYPHRQQKKSKKRAHVVLLAQKGNKNCNCAIERPTIQEWLLSTCDA